MSRQILVLGLAVSLRYYYFTGRLGLPNPYPNGTCSGASFLVTFPTGFDGVEDTYQTLGNVDIDVPASSATTPGAA